MMHHISLFAGMGGFDLGFHRAGIPTAGWSEIDKHAASLMRYHYPEAEELGDVTGIDGRPLGSTGTVLSGGFPCQDVSVAGRQEGLSGQRSGLFFDFARLAGESGAEWITVENVPGLLTSNRGRDFGTVIGTLEDIGYSLAWRVLDARYFGVAQRRRRVFIVGHRGNNWRPPGQVLDLPACSAGNPAAGITPRALLAGDTAESVGSDGGGTSRRVTFAKGRRAMSPTDHETWVERDFSPTLNVFDNTGEGRATVLTVNALTANGLGGGGPDDNLAQAGHLQATTSGVRRLTPVECERLQGFPDGWSENGTQPNGAEKPLSDSARYKLTGNAVCANVAWWIAARIKKISEA
jgi:DNA (cytosine-5)-methyltransferase 1